MTPELSLYDFTIASAIKNALYMVAAVLLYFVLLRLRNALTGNRFNEWWDNAARRGSMGGGIYLGLTGLGIAYVVGQFLN